MERALGVELGPDILKNIVHPGKGNLSDFRDGTKVWLSENWWIEMNVNIRISKLELFTNCVSLSAEKKP